MREYKLPRPLKAGDDVQITSLGKAGTVLEVSDKNDSVTVQAGIIKTRVPINELRLIEGDSAFFMDTTKEKVYKKRGKDYFRKKLQSRNRSSRRETVRTAGLFWTDISMTPKWPE